ncbi:UPF0014-domain-containing protein [Neoconidiobolus thromboides FSU 785]|nr:UPF0014-domain-containing protein [Neoconidiobolus thromboides FSU 785]
MDSSQCPITNNNKYVSVGWDAVGWSSLFVVFNIILSLALQLKMEVSLIIASVRCLAQLTLMAYILKPVLDSDEIWIPFLMAAIFVILASYETVYHQSKVRHRSMLIIVFISILISNGVVGIIGLACIIKVLPFWQPQQFIPIIGMLLGNSMSGMAVGISHCLQTLSTQKDSIEMYLSYGSTRWEASRPIAIQSIRLGMIPTINAMCVMGIISIPGMMTGQILGGADVLDAVRYQQVTMFMILSSTALGTLLSVSGALFVCIDRYHRHRADRIYNTPAWQEVLYIKYVATPISKGFLNIKAMFKNKQGGAIDVNEAFREKN